MLADLVAGNHARSMSRRLKEHLPAIEECIEAGFSHRAIHEWLVSAGLSISFKYYHAALARLRKASRPPGRGSPVGSPASSSKRAAPRDVPADEHVVVGMKGAANSSGIRQEDASAPRSIGTKPNAPRVSLARRLKRRPAWLWRYQGNRGRSRQPLSSYWTRACARPRTKSRRASPHRSTEGFFPAGSWPWPHSPAPSCSGSAISQLAASVSHGSAMRLLDASFWGPSPTSIRT